MDMGTGMTDEEISFLTDNNYELEDDDQPPLPTDPMDNFEESELLETNSQNDIELTMALALKGISKVSLNRREFENVSCHLGKIVSLHLQSKGIQALVPDVLESFYSLAHLYLYRNMIEKIQGLDCLPQLESLHLYENRIHRIENLENCTNLRRLYLGHNEIEVVEGLENLSMLLELHIEDQHLPPKQALLFCPNSMDTISRKLKVLNISGNQLESIEDLTCMNGLDTLYATRNNISTLNNVTITLQSLKHLRVVDFRDNIITKDPKYKECIVGHLSNIEVLDQKDINETTKCFLQRLCSIKTRRMRQKGSLPTISRSRASLINPSSSTFMSPSAFTSQNLQAPLQNTDVNLQSYFQFSTPTSLSPGPESKFQNLINPYGMPEEIQGQSMRPRQGNSTNAWSSTLTKKFYASRSMNELEEDKDPERMSEMAKIIFRLSNLSPSTDESVPRTDTHLKSGEGSYWGPLTVKESRPLSPLDVEGSSASSKPFGTRRSAPLRRPMTRKLQPRSFGAGRTLSPLEELQTPDSSHRGDWIDKSLTTSSVGPLPPWLNNRKKATVPPKPDCSS